MSLTRRQVLSLGALGATFAGCAPLARQIATDLPADIRLPEGNVEPTLRLVNRVSFGPTPGEILRVKSLGHLGYLREQLTSDQAEPAHLTMQLYRLDAYRMDSHEMEELPIEMILSQLQQGAILRACYNPNQLHERLIEFWTDHFNIYARKGSSAFRKGLDDTKVIREHALGNFKDLLSGSAHSPAMLAYLDNQVNVKGVANENYARELMELHTLGVHGGYSQRDVQEVARCFTGWGLEDRFLRPKGKFRFDAEKHDNGEKTVLGQKIPSGGGKKDGEIVLEMLALHPNTAQFICTKMARYFLGHAESKTIDRMVKTYLDNQADIRPLVKEMFSEENLLTAPPVLKRPFDYLVSCIRSTGALTDAGRPLQEHLDKMGMLLFQWPMPDGYPVKQEAWTGTLLARWNFAAAMAKNEVPGTVVDIEKLAERSKGDLPGVLLGSPELAKRISAQVPGEGLRNLATACLACPDFQWR